MSTDPTTGDRWTERLSEYLDGDLAPAERAALESHLATCAACSTVLDDLRLVVERSRTLETPPPPAGLWPGVLSRIEAEEAARRAPADIRRHRDWGRWRVSLSVPQALAAGLALVFLSGAGVWLALRGPAAIAPAPGHAPAVRGGATSAPLATTTSPDGPPAAPAGGATAGRPARADLPNRPDASETVMAAFSDPRYDATIAELQQVLVNQRGQLDTTTVRILEQNLAIIDRALEEARRAVAADPANSYLRTHLASTMRRKVDLLRRATVIVGAQG